MAFQISQRLAGQIVEVNFAGRGWKELGTIPASGVLDSSVMEAIGQGSLQIRVQGSGTIYTGDNQGMGIRLRYFGASNADGRGDDIAWDPSGAGAGMFLGVKVASGWRDDASANITQKSPFRLVAKLFAETVGCPVSLEPTTQGSTFLTRANGDPGDFEKRNLDTESMYNKMLYHADMYQLDGSPLGEPNFDVMYLGGNDAAQLVSETQFYDALVQTVADLQADIGLTKLYALLIGRERDNQAVNGIRAAVLQAAADSAVIEVGGACHNLPVGVADGQDVHYLTVAEKQAVADSIFRHLVGEGRGPRVATAVRAGNEITITLEGGVAPMTGHADHAGWYVTDDGAPIAITSAAGAGMQVVLTLDSVRQATCG